MTDDVRAYVTEVNGKFVLVDPDAVAVAQAISAPRRDELLWENRERIEHFIERAEMSGKDPSGWCIVVVEVDDPHGSVLVDALMPGANWQQYRDAGQQPFARGLAPRSAVTAFLEVVHPAAAQEMKEHPQDMLAVVFAGHGASVYNAVQRVSTITG